MSSGQSRAKQYGAMPATKLSELRQEMRRQRIDQNLQQEQGLAEQSQAGIGRGSNRIDGRTTPLSMALPDVRWLGDKSLGGG